MKRGEDYLYIQLSNTLREQISTGKIKPGESLMSENDLAKHYQMSRVSVRKSLQLLVADELILTQNGRCSIVNPAYIPPQNATFRIFADSPSYFVEYSLQAILAEFRQAHPDIDVQVLTFPKWIFWESIENVENSGLKADLILLTDSQLRHESDDSAWIDLKDEFDSEALQIYPRLLQSPSNTNGVLRSLPLSMSTVYLAYNPQIFQQQKLPIPNKNWSMDEFMDTAKALTLDLDKDGITDVYGFCLTPSWNRWPILAQQNNISFRNLNEEAERLAEVLERIRTMAFRDRSLLVYPKDIHGFGPFYNGKAAMTLTTNVELGVWRANGMPFAAKLAQLPFGPVRARRIGAIYGMVPESGDHRLSIEFLRLAIGDETQGQLVRSGMYLSVRRNINEGVWDQDDMEMLQEEELLGDQSYFMQELFPNRKMISLMEADMELFWSGVEAVGPLIERLKKIPLAEG